MTSKIAGFVTRKEAGLRDPRSVSRHITPEKGGVAIHYGGGPVSAAETDAEHAECLDMWRRWQRYHMDSHGWVDIAYTGGVCNHGYAFAGRGFGVRSAANGTNLGNQNFLAVCWIGGKGQTPTEAALDAFDWWLTKLRAAGAGSSVRPHNFFRTTGCPGDALEAYASERSNKPVFDPPPPAKPESENTTPTPSQVKLIQDILKVQIDGKWGPNTDRRATRLRSAARSKNGWPYNTHAAFDVKDVQEVIGTTVDGIWGPLSQAALVSWIKKHQKALGVKPDGLWGPKTDGKFINVRRRYLNKY